MKEELIISLLRNVDTKLSVNHLDSNGRDTILCGEEAFQVYQDSELCNYVKSITENATYYSCGDYPFSFACQLNIDSNCQYHHSFMIPKRFSDGSKAFFFHELHHALKDTNPYERIKPRVYSEVIPLFSELLMIEKEKNLSVKQEMIKSRLLLLKLDFKKYQETSQSNILYYLRNYYDALCLYHEYLRFPRGTLLKVSDILKHQMTTKELLEEYDYFNEGTSMIVEGQMKKYLKML